MNRTVSTALAIWRRRSFFWPVSISVSGLLNFVRRVPRGLIVEPSNECTGSCSGCPAPVSPAELDPRVFEGILKKRPVKPVTIHFTGRHSDPLASGHLPELVDIAARNSSMVSVSTIGLGLSPGWENLPVDRWIVSIPAATKESWQALRGNDRFGEAIDDLRRLVRANRSMVELVLTIWKPSAGDVNAFMQLAREEGVHGVQRVFGRFDPQGHHMGRLENIALDSPDCPYEMKQGLKLKAEPRGCPLAGTLFLDSSGVLHPCPFMDLTLEDPSYESTRKARGYPACRYCF